MNEIPEGVSFFSCKKETPRKKWVQILSLLEDPQGVNKSASQRH